MATVFREIGLKHVDYLSLDIEGSEPNAIQGADFGHTPIEIINIEGHGPEMFSGDSSNPVKRAADVLAERGFKYICGTGFRGGRAIDSLWIQNDSMWLEKCKWDAHGLVNAVPTQPECEE